MEFTTVEFLRMAPGRFYTGDRLNPEIGRLGPGREEMECTMQDAV